MFQRSHRNKIPPDEVEDNTRIEDTRNKKEFLSIAFSGFKKTDVRSQLHRALLDESSIEEACFWCAQLFSAGHLMDIWETILLVMSRHIHLGNPKLPLYIEMRYTQFREYLFGEHTGYDYLGREEQLRNHAKCRSLFAEMCGVICVARKKQVFKAVSVSERDFDMFHLPSLLRAPTPNYIRLPSSHYQQGVWKEDDPQELMVASNELAYHVSREARDERRAMYWFEWILQYLQRVQTNTKKGKQGKTQIQSCICSSRKHCVGNRDLSRDVLGHPVWLVWDILLNEASRRNELTLFKCLKKMMELFGIQFTKSTAKKRKYMIYMGISLLCEPVAWDIPILSSSYKPLVSMAKRNIPLIYKQLKKDEVIEDNIESPSNTAMDLLYRLPSASSNHVSQKPSSQSIPQTSSTSNKIVNVHNIPYASSPSTGMPPTHWERNQIAEMIVERDDTRHFI